MAYARGYSRLERILVKFPKPNYLLPYVRNNEPRLLFIFSIPSSFLFLFHFFFKFYSQFFLTLVHVAFRLTESTDLHFILRQLLHGLILK